MQASRYASLGRRHRCRPNCYCFHRWACWRCFWQSARRHAQPVHKPQWQYEIIAIGTLVIFEMLEPYPYPYMFSITRKLTLTLDDVYIDDVYAWYRETGMLDVPKKPSKRIFTLHPLETCRIMTMRKMWRSTTAVTLPAISAASIHPFTRLRASGAHLTRLLMSVLPFRRLAEPISESFMICVVASASTTASWFLAQLLWYHGGPLWFFLLSRRAKG